MINRVINYNKRQIVSNLIYFFVLFVGSIIMLVPFIWMILTSFKNLAETLQIPIVWLPKKFSFDNYIEVLNGLNFFQYYKNTIFVTVIVVIFQLFFCSLAGYAFARISFPLRDTLFFIMLLILMVPAQIMLLPRYVMLTKINWHNTFKGIIIPMIPSAYGTFFLRQFFKSLPGELEDAAKIDGCNYWRIYWNIFLPLCNNALIAYGVLTTLWAWNELLWPLVIINSDKMKVLSLAVAMLQGQYATKYNILMASSVMATIPMVVLFIIAQKYFIQGIAITGIKG